MVSEKYMFEGKVRSYNSNKYSLKHPAPITSSAHPAEV
jgi:hypothetical protein